MTDEKDDHAIAMRRWLAASEAETKMREDAMDDLRFKVGEQWADSIRKSREADGRPCLTVNRFPQVISQVVNEQRQSRPSVQVNPIGDGADTETAKIYEGIIRHIDSISNSEIAIDTAFESMVSTGFGYFRLLTQPMEYGKKGDLEILTKRILNPFCVYFDPGAQEPDYSDARYAFIVEDVPRDSLEEDYPDAEMPSAEQLSGIGDARQDWASERTVRIAEYFNVEQKGGKRTVRWRKMTAAGFLPDEDTVWPGCYIPIIPVLAPEYIVDGKRHFASLIRYAKDPQRMLNYWVSAQTEAIALAPRAPWMAAEGQIEGHEVEYADSNRKNISVLYYKPTVEGVPVPAPHRNTVEPAIEAISAAILQSSADIKATTGLYDASLGAPSNERSGRAVLARQKEGDVANLHFSDNLSRAIKYYGKQLVDLIPKVIDTERAMHITRPDQTLEEVVVNAPFFKDGMAKLYDLSAGRYDVSVSVGPNYASKRQEAVQSMLELVKAEPQIVQVVGDLLVKNMDWPGADAVADRLHKMLPPQLQDQKDGQQPIPPQIQAQMVQQGQMVQQLTGAVHQLKNEIDAKTVETQSRERIAAMQEETKRVIAFATLDQQQGLSLLQADLQGVKHRMDMLHQSITQQHDHEHEMGMTALDQQHQGEMQQIGQSHEAAQQQSAQDAAAQQAKQSQTEAA